MSLFDCHNTIKGSRKVWVNLETASFANATDKCGEEEEITSFQPHQAD